MDLAGELIKGVFSKAKPDMSGRCGFRFGERRKWGCVGSYPCGDEFGSVTAKEDSASPLPLPGKSEEMLIAEEKAREEKPNSMFKLFREQDAAIVIQTAFRSCMARNQRKEETANNRSPNVESINTYIEVHSAYSVQLISATAGKASPAREPSGGESVETPSENMAQGEKLQRDRSTPKRKPRILVSRAKEEWDNSTVSSNVAETRIKRRVEAMTRRERALAYAFSQQLRVCSRKGPEEGEEPNTGWSWLERWMATRPSENSSPLIPLDGNIGAIHCKQQCGKTRRKSIDLAWEEKESCGSNEVPLNMGSFIIGSGEEIKKSMQSKNRLKTLHRTVAENSGNQESFPIRRHQKIVGTDRCRESKVSSSRREESKQCRLKRRPPSSDQIIKPLFSYN